ncbi:MAG TPA: peptide-methionine (R)-S-oxide reductase MsrB [Candidatus Saccharimonadales bacterium]|nr:peptide-methionine (R)-S-oxide reductase MsrB [Candidatus Saccharimonadales bacterium]
MGDASQTTDDEWKQKLTPEQYEVLRRKGTEAPFSGKLLHNQATGEYACAACGTVLFTSHAKYESNTPGLSGWPSFSKVAESDKVELRDDNSWGMHRTEVICKTCGSHLGHVFDDEDSPSGQHFCINSTALQFMPKSDKNHNS